EIRESLANLPANLFGDILQAGGKKNSREDAFTVKPGVEAVDFEDIDELAEDVYVDSVQPDLAFDDFQMDVVKEEENIVLEKEKKEQVDMRTMFPSFQKGKPVKFTELLISKEQQRVYKKMRSIKALEGVSSDDFEYVVDQAELAKNPILLERYNSVKKTNVMDIKSIASRAQFSKSTEENMMSNHYQSVIEEMNDKQPMPEVGFRMRNELTQEEEKRLYEYVEKIIKEKATELDDWESRIVWDWTEWGKLNDPNSLRGLYSNSFGYVNSNQIKQITMILLNTWREKITSLDELIIRNYDFEFGDWDERIILDDEQPPAKLFVSHLILNKNDPFYVFDDTPTIQEIFGRQNPQFHDPRRHPGLLPYQQYPPRNMPERVNQEDLKQENMFQAYKGSLDKFNLSNDRYYETKTKGRIRHTFGQSIVQHSYPALKLLPALFKTCFTRSEMRNWHRPPFDFVAGSRITFVKSKNHHLKESPSHIPKNVHDLSVKDDGDFVLLEYSEEYPPIVMNVSMGTLINTYYRKKGEADLNIPKNEIGSPVILENVDASPFFTFGNVDPGQTIQCVYNNLFRAPIFEQPLKYSDFLLIRCTSKEGQRHYIRNIEHSFLVGQTFPLMEVPSVHSRKVSLYLKSRVQFTAWRLLKKSQSPEKSFRLPQLTCLFRETTEANIRKWLKDFAETRSKSGSGTWYLKPGSVIPSDDELRKIVNPEMACLYESMLAGQQRLKDSGYVHLAVDTEEAEETLDDEVKLAPWMVTRNFINATQDKAMLQLTGFGDPTGKGEGFSFVKSSIRQLTSREGDSKVSLNDQRMAYKEEINKIWKAQLNSLSNTNEPEFLQEDEINRQKFEIQKKEIDFDDDVTSIASFGSKSSKFEAKPKILTIKRNYKMANGMVRTESEVVTDPKVINAYVRQKQLLNSRKSIGTKNENSNPFVNPFNNTEQDEGKKKSSILRCSSCGQTGHNRNNKVCPNYTGNVIEDLLFDDDESVISRSNSLKSKKAKLSKKKKLAVDVEDNFKGVKRKRPLTELSLIFEDIINTLMAIPAAFAFRDPVDTKIYKDYLLKIKQPRDLSTIKKNFKHVTASTFLKDLQIMADNCSIYNGPDHTLTNVATFLVSKAESLLADQHVKISELEKEIESTQVFSRNL
ncbi:hypothetical protein ROZALSC1DRAFT_27300, partial [Rozella allomycis CSF55]